ASHERVCHRQANTPPMLSFVEKRRHNLNQRNGGIGRRLRLAENPKQLAERDPRVRRGEFQNPCETHSPRAVFDTRFPVTRPCVSHAPPCPSFTIPTNGVATPRNIECRRRQKYQGQKNQLGLPDSRLSVSIFLPCEPRGPRLPLPIDFSRFNIART